MGNIYTVNFDLSAVATAMDLFNITVVNPNRIRILEARIGQDNLEGDSAAQMLKVRWVRAAADGSGGSVLTPRPHNEGDPAATSVVRGGDTTPAASPTVIYTDAWNLQGGWPYVPIPELVIAATSTNKLILTLPTAPAQTPNIFGCVTFEELLG